MAERAIILTKKVTKIGDMINVDACLDETHQLSNTVTDHPVEEGFNVTDHSRPNPDRVTLRCFISNTPLSPDQTTKAVREGAISFEPGENSEASRTEAQLNNVRFQTTAIRAALGRGETAYSQLKKYQEESTLIEVVTTLKSYGLNKDEGMMIESISIPRTKQNYDGLEFSIQLKQIRIVRNKQTRDTRPKEKQTHKKEHTGAKTTAPPARKVTALKTKYRQAGGTR